MIEALMEVRGVRYAALVDAAGKAAEQVGSETPDLSIAVSAGAMIGSLKGAMNASDWNDLLLDIDGGPVLLTPVATPLGEQILMVAFDDIASLGRVRFAVKRTLAK